MALIIQSTIFMIEKKHGEVSEDTQPWHGSASFDVPPEILKWFSLKEC